MESSLRAFMLLMFMLAAGMAGVSVSTRPAAGPADNRVSEDRRGTVALYVTSQPEMHFVFGNKLRHTAMPQLPGSAAMVTHQRGPRPTQVQYVDVPLTYEPGTRQAPTNPHPFSKERFLTSEPAELRQIDPSLGGEVSDVAVARGVWASPHDALSYYHLRIWDIDPDESQVALLWSLCRPHARMVRPFGGHQRHVSVGAGRSAAGSPSVQPTVRRWMAYAHVTWTQFCNWLNHKYLRQKAPDGPSTEAAAESLAVTLEEYDELLQAITARPSSKNDPQATAAIALGDPSSP